ncbi:MAG: hypothetical protein LBS96_09875 [Oscillospiraceae bacterium]|jgi:stage III sporulation protein AG|nr:hypothetical protein [Oscillospiraceae bacterium]
MKRSEGTDGGGLAGLLQKLKLGKWHAIVIAAGLVGILLLCLSALPGKADANSSGGAENIRIDLTAYEEQIEKRLGELLGSIEGAGETRVMLTLDCGSEPIYATQGKSNQSASAAEGTSQESYSMERAYVILGTGSGEKGLVLKTLEPKVRGVAVLCQGADSTRVQQNIVAAVTAVLGVGSNKVSVGKLA